MVRFFIIFLAINIQICLGLELTKLFKFSQFFSINPVLYFDNGVGNVEKIV